MGTKRSAKVIAKAFSARAFSASPAGCGLFRSVGRAGHQVRTFIPEGAGPVNLLFFVVIFFWSLSACSWARRDEASVSRIDPAGSTASRPKVLDAGAGRRMLFRGGEQ
jgi:hypothetical protein